MRKNGFVIMFQLLKMVKPLAHIMFFTIVMGVLGFLCAIFITVIGAMGLVDLISAKGVTGITTHLNWQTVMYVLIALAVARGILRYLEQMSGHYIAFKLLALLRDKVFTAMRKLALEKLQNKQAGQLVALVTNDIELLEVFYAHTIAPVMIALITSLILIAIFAHISPWLAIIATLAYLTVGAFLPMLTTALARDDGRKYRELVGDMNDYFLDSIRGMKEIQLFNFEDQRLDSIQVRSENIDQAFLKIKQQEGKVRSYTEIAVSSFNILMLIASLYLFIQGQITFMGLLLAMILIMSSFGPVIAISNLSNNLLQTLASGERLLGLLAEEPVLKDITTGKNLTEVQNLQVGNISFAYQTTHSNPSDSESENPMVLENISLSLNKGEILGILGRSGSGKSTLLKLIMRFYAPQVGAIKINGLNIEQINTTSLRENIAYITQQTYIFNQSIYENLALANRKATQADIEEACRKAHIHDFILSLPDGYNTVITEMGSSLSDGEKQRIGIARAFLHNAPIILLDEPTSNLDSLNEAIILQSLLKAKADKIMILVSHRKSTMSICDQIINLHQGKAS